MYQDCETRFSVAVLRVRRESHETEYRKVLACQRPKGHKRTGEHDGHMSWASKGK
jgi:hypothetical protein